MAAWHALDAGTLASLYARGEASPVEVTRGLLDRHAAWGPALNATYALDPDAALAAARASEARWHAGQPLSPLDGVPALLKENIATAGTPMPLGTAATALAPAAADAPPAARLREAGVVCLGKTTMPDYGMLTSGMSSAHGTTRNPWDLATNPGGSSSGAAACAAAGIAPLHVGTDIGGSVRLPASLCGIVTLKPSLGRIPIQPPYAGRVAGPMTRTVADTARLMAALARPDARDTMSLPHQPIDWAAAHEVDPAQVLRGRRVALMADAGWGLPVEPEVRAAVEAAARAFEAAGAIVEPIGPISRREMVDGLDLFWRLRAWLDISALPPERRAQVLPYIVAWARTAEGASGEAVFRGHAQIGALRDAAVAATQPYDLVLSPTCPVAAFPAEWASPINDPARPFEHIAFTLPYNMSEQPAATLPCGHGAGGAPIGLQIAGRRHDDLGVLRAARAWELLRPAGMLRPWPEPPAGGH